MHPDDERGPDASERKRCQKHTKSGKPCRNWAIKGLDACRMHAGMKTADAVAKGQQNIARKKIGEMLAVLHPDETFQDPLKGLLLEVAWSHAAVRVLGQQVSELEALHAPTRKVTVKGGEQVVTAGDHRIHVAVQMWNEERERHARFCKMALEAGVAERQVKIAEEQGVTIANVMVLVIDDPTVGLTAEQRVAMKRAGARHLRALPTGA